ncbi:MAG: SDR family oxidoreductase [SAR324 cluster bacterium]|nr:SDR family oxidoreductase [SAR324 cluster bacterium]
MTLNSTLEGKIAFITGGTRGIGWATAKLFACKGATIILNSISDESVLHARVEELQTKFGVKCDSFSYDVGDREAVKECYAAIFKRFKRLDILVNNAGVLNSSLLGMITSENIDHTINTNVKGMLYNMQSASRLMTRNHSGSIINLSSIMGRFGAEGQTVYAGSKAAVIGMSCSAAKELAAQNIRVNVVAPGFIDTEMANEIPPEKFQERIESIKMNRIGTPDEVANVIYFFASDLSTYVTGQVLGVDGGMVI